MTNWRERCAELLQALETEGYAHWTVTPDKDELCLRTRAELAQPELEGMPDHVNLICFAFGREPWATWLRKGGCLESAHCELSDLMLAVLDRWGRPAAQQSPVSSDNLFGVPAVLTHDSADNPVLLPMLNLATTSEQIPPGPYSEHELRTQWNAQADEFNQWESLDLSEQLAWAQARAIAADGK